MALHSQLPLYKTVHELTQLVINTSRNMPRDYKRTLGERMVSELIAISHSNRGNVHPLPGAGLIVADTIHPTVVAIARRDRISVFRNIAASEPRYEAWSKQAHWGISFIDPSEAVLNCATAIRRGIRYPDHVDRHKSAPCTTA